MTLETTYQTVVKRSLLQLIQNLILFHAVCKHLVVVLHKDSKACKQLICTHQVQELQMNS